MSRLRQTRLRPAPLLAALGLLTVLSGCQRDGGSALAAEGADKVNAYIACFNGVEQPVQESFQEYVSWIKDPEAGPTGKETTVRGPGTVLSHRVEACGEPMTAALAQKPANAAIDPAARAYQEQFKVLNERIEDASRYYAREDYRRDGGEGMKQRHAPLMAAYASFAEASEALDAALEKNEETRRRAQLAEIEKDEGRSAAYFHLRILGDGKDLVSALNHDAPDLAVARERLARYQSVLEEAQKAKIGDGDAMWGHMQRSADGLAREAGRRIERVQANTPLSRGDEILMQNGGMAPSGTRPALLDKYNDLVDMSNRMTR